MFKDFEDIFFIVCSSIDNWDLKPRKKMTARELRTWESIRIGGGSCTRRFRGRKVRPQGYRSGPCIVDGLPGVVHYHDWLLPEDTFRELGWVQETHYHHCVSWKPAEKLRYGQDRDRSSVPSDHSNWAKGKYTSDCADGNGESKHNSNFLPLDIADEVDNKKANDRSDSGYWLDDIPVDLSIAEELIATHNGEIMHFIKAEVLTVH